jgi:hypothetical protein
MTSPVAISLAINSEALFDESSSSLLAPAITHMPGFKSIDLIGALANIDANMTIHRSKICENLQPGVGKINPLCFYLGFSVG